MTSATSIKVPMLNCDGDPVQHQPASIISFMLACWQQHLAKTLLWLTTAAHFQIFLSAQAMKAMKITVSDGGTTNQ